MANAKLDVEIAGFVSNINSAKGVLKGLNAEMKAADAAFKATGNAEQQMAAKTKVLNSQIQMQKGIADQAAQALKAMTDAGVDPMDAAYQRLYATMQNATAGMNNAQAELNGLSGSAQGAAASADQLTDSVQNIGKKISLDQVITGIDKITSGLERAAKKALQFGEDLWNTIMDSARRADDTATMAEMYGIPLERFLQMQRLVGGGMDTTVDAMLSSMDKLNKGIGNETKTTIEALQSLGIEYKHLAGDEGVGQYVANDPSEVFWEAGQALLAMGDAFDKEAAAQALFGKSWKELKPLFDTYKSLEEYNKALDEMTVTDEDTVRDLAALNDAVSNLEASWTTLKDQVLGSLAPALTKGADAISGLLDNLTKYLQTDDGQKLLENLGTAVSGLFDDLGKIDSEDVVNNFTSVFNGLVGSLQWIVNNKDTLIGALEAIVAGWAGLKITGGLLQIIQFINNLKDLKAGGNNQPDTGTGTTGTTGATGTTGNVMFDPKLAQAAATSMVLGTTWNLIENADVFKNGDLSEEDQIKNWVSEQVKDGFIDAGKSDEITEKNLKMFEILKEHGKDADIPVSVVPEASEGAAADIAAQIGPVPVQLSFGGGGGGMVDILSEMLTPRIFANGIHSVPYDGMLARLHKGERVMPAREVQSRSYNSNLYVESMYMNNGTDAAGLASAMAAAQRRTMSGFGS